MLSNQRNIEYNLLFMSMRHTHADFDLFSDPVEFRSSDGLEGERCFSRECRDVVLLDNPRVNKVTHGS